MDKTTPTLGQILDKNVNQRDAIHIAVAPVTAAHRLMPGLHVSLVDMDVISSRVKTPTIGIVDPFLTSPVEKGERCWLFLYPGTITGLRHAWTHPAFRDMIKAKRMEVLKTYQEKS